MRYRPLGQTGLDLSVLSFGASSLGGVFHSVTLDDNIETVHAALEGVDRSRYILVTKIGSYSEARGHVDILQCHDIEFADHDRIVDETLPALHRLMEQGPVRHVGITGLPLNFPGRSGRPCRAAFFRYS